MILGHRLLRCFGVRLLILEIRTVLIIIACLLPHESLGLSVFKVCNPHVEIGSGPLHGFEALLPSKLPLMDPSRLLGGLSPLKSKGRRHDAQY
jgi:hypothetical protein